MEIPLTRAPAEGNGERPIKGLVLEGGGAKGSFQFGCLHALHERGATFDAVSGTSVGALNAALWSTEQIDWGNGFWRNISLSKVYPFRRPVVVFTALAIIYGLIKASMAWIGQRSTFESAMGFSVAFGVICGVAGIVIYLPLALATLLSGGDVPIWTGLATISCSMVCAVPFVFALLVEHFGISMLTAKPLETELTRQLTGERASFAIPTFATLAVPTGVYDPDHLQYRSTGIPPSAAISMPFPAFRHVPRYVRLDQAEGDEVRLLLASAALPFGIVPAVKGAVDGGMADNLPMYPLVSLFPCDTVLIIRAGVGPIGDDVLRRTWSSIDRLLRLLRYDGESAHAANRKVRPRYPGEDVSRDGSAGEAEPTLPPPRFPRVHVVSREDEGRPFLGDFLGRTMNFSREFTRSQFEKGHRRMTELLDTGALDEFIEGRPERLGDSDGEAAARVVVARSVDRDGP